ncbi:MAG TPA: hypothetical protein PLT66_04250 [Bacillota bacterium]|nr:hypothetical protein [Bacillota bacterium]
MRENIILLNNDRTRGTIKPAAYPVIIVLLRITTFFLSSQSTAAIYGSKKAAAQKRHSLKLNISDPSDITVFDSEVADKATVTAPTQKNKAKTYSNVVLPQKRIYAIHKKQPPIVSGKYAADNFTYVVIHIASTIRAAVNTQPTAMDLMFLKSNRAKSFLIKSAAITLTRQAANTVIKLSSTTTIPLAPMQKKTQKARDLFILCFEVSIRIYHLR